MREPAPAKLDAWALLRDHQYYHGVLQRLILGYEDQWKQAVRKGLQHMQEELGICDAREQYGGMCRVIKELFLRELRGKATRILAHKKRQIKKKAAGSED